MDTLNRTSANNIRDSLAHLRKHEAHQTMHAMTRDQLVNIVGRWRDDPAEDGSAFDMLGGYVGYSKATQAIRSSLKHLDDLIDTLLTDFRRTTALRVLHICQTLLEDGYENPDEAIETAVSGLLHKTVVDDDSCDAAEYAMTLAEKKPDTCRMGCTWGIPDLDSIIPMRKGTMICLAAPTGGGKTSLGVQISRETMMGGYSVLYISMEMTREQLMARMAKQVTGISEHHVMDGTYHNDHERGEVREAFREFTHGNKMTIRDGTGYDVEKIRRAVRIETLKRQVDLVVIDHFHLIRSINRENEYERFSNASLVLGSIAKDFDVCILNMAQFNKANQDAGHEKDGSTAATKEPQLSDLRGSSDLTNVMAGAVLLWVRDNKNAVREITACVRKNRFGPNKDLDLSFNPSMYGVFEKAEHTEKPKEKKLWKK